MVFRYRHYVSGAGFLKKIEICGSKGCITLEEESITTWQFAEEQPEDEEIRRKYGSATKTGGGASDPKAIGYHGHKRLFQAFVDSQHEDKPADYWAASGLVDGIVSGAEGRKSVEIIEAAYRSARTNSPVSLPL